MRVFEGVDDVREYLVDQAKAQDGKAETAAASAKRAMDRGQRGRRAELAMTEHAAKAAARAYQDAADALHEIRPGLIGAIERGEITVTIPAEAMAP